MLLWLPSLPVFRPLVPIVSGLAAASMFIYLTHWQFYPHLEDELPWLATLLSLGVGVVVWKLYTVVQASVGRIATRLTRRPAAERRR